MLSCLGAIYYDESHFTPMSYRSIVFIDLDGTLIVNPFETAVWPSVTAELAAKTGLPAESLMAEIAAEYFARQADESVSAIAAMDWDDIAQTVARRRNVRLEANCVALVEQHAASHSTALAFAHEALHELAAPGRALVVATKGLARYQRPVLEALGLTPYFTAFLTPDVHNGLKKHRRFFGDWPERAPLSIMVGDLYDDDVRYPSGHGFRTIWKPGSARIPAELHALDPFERARRYPYAPDQPHPATARILSLRELPAAVRAIEEQAGR
jgi:FMN phosphatase YigB (HAD superfamily)